MTSLKLLEPYLDENIRHAHWFNGRLLSAESLQSDQEAQRCQREQLGRAIGAGVVHGLEVSLNTAVTAPTVTVNAGSALNRLGQVVELLESVDVSLGEPAAPEAVSAGLFASCEASTTEFVGAGFYILVAMPTSEYQERVPLHNIYDSGIATSCGSRYETSGVSFRLICVDIENPSLLDPNVKTQLQADIDVAASEAATEAAIAMAQSKVRNLMAHWCLGASDSAVYAANLYTRLTTTGDPPSLGLADRLRLPTINLLQDCDVPLALIYWTTDGPQFVDNWAMRRQLLADPTGLFTRRSNSLWLERFNQFLFHVEDLARTLTNRNLVEVQQYFYYLPPIGLFPVDGAGLPGFSASQLFSQFATNAAGSLHADQLAMLLLRSAPCSSIDLADVATTVQTYQVVENQQAINAGGTKRSYYAFVSRTVHGPEAQDGVVKASRQAWSVYRDLLRRQVFLPRAVNSDAVDARLAITDALRDVMDVANSLSTTGAAFSLDAGAARSLFSDMYQVQDDLAVLYKSNIPGTIHQAFRQSFGTTLDGYLHNTAVGEPPGLLPAIQSRSLVATVAAQKRINGFVGRWVGDSVAIGFVEVIYESSPRGDQLVPGDADAYTYRFRVTNQTNQRLVIQLEAAILPAWDGHIEIQDEAGASITDITLDKAAPQDDAPWQVVIVSVTVPDTAVIDDIVILELRATVPEPHNKQDTANRQLTVADSSGPPVVHNVELTPVSQPSNTDDLDEGEGLIYAYDLILTAGAAPFEGSFTTTVTLEETSGPVEDWFVDFSGAPREVLAPGVFMTPYDLDANAPAARRLTIRIKAPLIRGAVDKTVTMIIRTESTTLPGLTPDDRGPFTLRLRQS